MPIRSRVNVLPLEVAAYIAGLIDGEGTITLTRLHASEMRRLVVSIASTEIVLLRYVLREVGAGKITRKKVSSEKHAPSFCFAITSQQALVLLRQIAPYLRSYKRQRAELAIGSYERLTPRNGKYSVHLLLERREFENDLLSLKPKF